VGPPAKALDDLNLLVKLMLKWALERMLDTQTDDQLERRGLPESMARLLARPLATSDAARNRQTTKTPP
jgi:hypothetical protein